MITSFKGKAAETIWNGEFARRLPPELARVSRRKLRMLNNAQDLNDLRIPPANRLEALRGSREGQHSIRINNQWRVCFNWINGNAENVEIVDYHQ